jgi:hypothetical protein
MYDMLPRLRRGGGDQRRMKRGLAVVQVALRQDADHVIGVQVNRVRIRRRAITAAPAHNLPRPGPEEVFPRHRGEGRLDPRVPDATGCHDLLCKGAPDDFQFGLAIHLGCRRVSRSRPRITWPVHRLASKERVMALRRGFSSILKTGLRGSEDFREGVEAIGAKRKPSFRGR